MNFRYYKKGQEKLKERLYFFIAALVVVCIVAYILLGGKAHFTDSFEEREVLSKTHSAIVAVVPKEFIAYAKEKIVPSYELLEFYAHMEPYRFKSPEGLSDADTDEGHVLWGTGFIVSPDGYIVTDKRTVSKHDDYVVLTTNGEEYAVEFIVEDPVFDLAILKVVLPENALPLHYLEFSEDFATLVGSDVYALGGPEYGDVTSISPGVITGVLSSSYHDIALNQEVFLSSLDTSSTINIHNTGGPLVDADGHVVGLSVYSKKGFEKESYVLSEDIVSQIVDSVVEFGDINIPYLGVRYVPINPSLQEEYELSVDYGVLVGGLSEQEAVIQNSPADKVGVVRGDIITVFDGVLLDGTRSFYTLLREKKSGEAITLEVLHNGVLETIQITLE